MKRKKNGVITGVISTMELDLEESECFNFFRLQLHLHCLRSNENQIVDVRSSWGKINQSKCLFPEFLFDLFLPPLHVTLTTSSSLESKQRSHKERHIVFFSKLKHSTLLISPTSTLTAITN